MPSTSMTYVQRAYTVIAYSASCTNKTTTGCCRTYTGI